MKTDRLRFSLWQPTDIRQAFSLWGNSAVTQFISIDEMSREIVQKQLLFEIAHQEEFNVQYWPLSLHDTGEFIGCCGLHAFDKNNPGYLKENIYELGFHLKKEYWGMGYAKEAAEAVIDYGFDVLALNAIFAGHHLDNHSSAKLLIKLGFQLTGKVYYPPTRLEHPSYLLPGPAEQN